MPVTPAGSRYRIAQYCGARTRTGGRSSAGRRMDTSIASYRRPRPEDAPGAGVFDRQSMEIDRERRGVFNNLVMFKQDVPQNSPQSIVPDLATEWSWDEDKTQRTFSPAPRRQVARRQ